MKRPIRFQFSLREKGTTGCTFRMKRSASSSPTPPAQLNWNGMLTRSATGLVSCLANCSSSEVFPSAASCAGAGLLIRKATDTIARRPRSVGLLMMSSVARLLAAVCCHGLLDLGFHGVHVEARSLLHRGKVDEGLGNLRDFLLDEDEAPELILVPVHVPYGAGGTVRQTRPLQRIQAQ